MLKIPELPIYNTEKYTNFNPISPDDINQGQIYTNDELFIYVTYLSNNKTANYVPWNGDGEYVGIDMSSSDNIYAIATFLNNNNFRPLDYDLEVIDPYNTDRRLLLTPNGIKKVSDVKESISRIVKTVLKENFAEQWEDEINIFFNGLRNGNAIVDNGFVAVEWGHNESDPRFIYYKEGEDRLTDDHFSQQHSRRLYWNEISEIKHCAKQLYGVNIEIPDDEYYDEVYGDMEANESVVKTKLAKAINGQVRRILKENIDGGHRIPKSIQGRMNQIYRAVNKYGLSSKKFYDECWNALNLYDKVISDLGYELSYWCENGGYCDYDEYTHMPMSKQYEIVITCEDGVEIGGYIKMMAAGTVEDPFDAYDTCMVLWPRR